MKIYPYDYALPLETDARETHNLMRRVGKKEEIVIRVFLKEPPKQLCSKHPCNGYANSHCT